VRNCRKGFTLTEMAVVMGMIILFIGMAIPTVRALAGNSSINMARNQLASFLVRVREEAVAMQDYRGVLFVIDPTTNRVMCVAVQTASNNDYTHFPGSMIFLDAEPNRDTVALPTGVRLQTMFNGLQAAPSGGGGTSNSSQGLADRYLGFNPVITHTPFTQDNQYQRYYGGCILFDGNGALVVKPYALQLAMPKPDGSNAAVVSRLGIILGADQPPPPVALYGEAFATGTGLASWAQLGQAVSNSGASSALVPGCPSGLTSSYAGPFVVSQVGLVLFDGDAFRTLGFTDEDADLMLSGGPGYTVAWKSGISEQTEEIWLDNNSTPVMINRFDGTLIRGE
jgi:type II secretory pathway pseudopilin PulG